MRRRHDEEYVNANESAWHAARNVEKDDGPISKQSSMSGR
jgi:hypothetical protein